MLYRLKFRVYAGDGLSKFAYNLREGAPLHLNEHFRRVENLSQATYSLSVEQGATIVNLLDAEAQWNGRSVLNSKVTIEPGHFFRAKGVAVEVLDCPHRKARNAEATQFIDLGAATQKPAQVTVPETKSAPATTPTPAGEDMPDKTVVPISLAQFGKPEVQEAFAVDESEVTAKTKRPRKDLDPWKESLKSAGLTAALFAVAIVLTYKISQRHQIALFDDDEANSTFVAVSEGPIRKPEHTPPPEMATATRASAAVKPAEPHGTPSPSVIKALAKAIDDGNVKLVSRFFEGSVPINPDLGLDELGRTPFLRAAASGQVRVLQYLQTRNVASMSSDYNGNNALMWATINGQEPAVKFLLGMGFNPATQRDDGKTALKLAIENHRPKITALLSARMKAMPKAGGGFAARLPASVKKPAQKH